MTFKQLVKHFGGVAQAARAIGMTRMGLYLWRNRPIPYPKQLLIQEVSEGQLKAVKVAK